MVTSSRKLDEKVVRLRLCAPVLGEFHTIQVLDCLLPLGVSVALLGSGLILSLASCSICRHRLVMSKPWASRSSSHRDERWEECRVWHGMLGNVWLFSHDYQQAIMTLLFSGRTFSSHELKVTDRNPLTCVSLGGSSSDLDLEVWCTLWVVLFGVHVAVSPGRLVSSARPGGKDGRLVGRLLSLAPTCGLHSSLDTSLRAPTPEPSKETECKWLSCALAFSRLLVAVAVSRPGAPVPPLLGVLGFCLVFLPLLSDVTFGLRPRASHSCSRTGGTSDRKQREPTPKPVLSGIPLLISAGCSSLCSSSSLSFSSYSVPTSRNSLWAFLAGFIDVGVLTILIQCFRAPQSTQRSRFSHPSPSSAFLTLTSHMSCRLSITFLA